MKAIFLSGFITLSFGVLVAPGLAEAVPITYSWTGAVNRVDPGPDPGVALGQTIGITLTLDNAFSDDDPSPQRGSYSATPATLPLVLGIDIAGDTDYGAFQTVTVLAGSGGVDSVEINSSSIHTGLGFDILFQTNHVGVLSSDAIPSSIDPRDFDIATFSVDRFPAFTDFLPSIGGTISSSTMPVPEPNSLVILASVLLGLAGMRRRQRRGRCCFAIASASPAT